MSSDDIPSRYIFILGAPRSGTTLLLNMLVRGQPRIGGVAKESKFYSYICERPFQLETYLENKRVRSYFDRLVGLEAIKDLFCSSSSHLELFKKCIDRHLSSNDKSVFVEKSPQHTRYWRRLVRDFDQPLILLIKRNPAAVIHSMIKTPWISLRGRRMPKWIRESYITQYAAACIKYFVYSRRIRELERYPRLVSFNYEEIVAGHVDVKEVMEDCLGFELAPLYVQRPFSAEVNHQRRELDKSRINGYKEAMPRYAQLLTKLFFPGWWISSD